MWHQYTGALSAFPIMDSNPSYFRIFLSVFGIIIALAAGAFAWNSQKDEPEPRTPVIAVGTASAVQTPPCRIIALGDSITAGYELDPADAYPAQLEILLRKDGLPCSVTNGGVSGDTSRGLLDRLEFTLGEDRYDLAILTIGGNDGLRLLPTEDLEKNIAEMVATLRKRGIPVLITGMQIPNNAGAYAKDFREVYPRLAKANDLPLYPFFLEDVAMDPRYNLRDGIHPNRE